MQSVSSNKTHHSGGVATAAAAAVAATAQSNSSTAHNNTLVASCHPSQSPSAAHTSLSPALLDLKTAASRVHALVGSSKASSRIHSPFLSELTATPCLDSTIPPQPTTTTGRKKKKKKNVVANDSNGQLDYRSGPHSIHNDVNAFSYGDHNHVHNSSNISGSKKKKGKVSHPGASLDHYHLHHPYQHPNNNSSNNNSVFGGKPDDIWYAGDAAERSRLRDFWLQLSEEDRGALVKLEKEAVLKKVRDQQKQTCSCHVCGRRRMVLGEELEELYDAYYNELQQFANDHNAGTPSKQHPHHASYCHNEDDIHDENCDAESDDSGILEFGTSLTVKGGILTVADDFLKNDGQKFLNLMEQLSQRRLQSSNEEDEFAGMSPPNDVGYDDYNEDDEDEFSADGPDYLTEQQRKEEGRRMFQIFAAKMFEQRVLAAYHEKLSQERQNRLIEELEAEEREQQEQERAKQEERERKKAQRQAIQKKKEEEKIRLEEERLAQQRAEEERVEKERQLLLAERAKRDAELKQQQIEQERAFQEVERTRKNEEKRKKKEMEEESRKQRQREATEKLNQDRARLKQEKQDRKERERKEAAANSVKNIADVAVAVVAARQALSTSVPPTTGKQFKNDPVAIPQALSSVNSSSASTTEPPKSLSTGSPTSHCSPPSSAVDFQRSKQGKQGKHAKSLVGLHPLPPKPMPTATIANGDQSNRSNQRQNAKPSPASARPLPTTQASATLNQTISQLAQKLEDTKVSPCPAPPLSQSISSRSLHQYSPIHAQSQATLTQPVSSSIPSTAPGTEQLFSAFSHIYSNHIPADSTHGRQTPFIPLHVSSGPSQTLFGHTDPIQPTFHPPHMSVNGLSDTMPTANLHDQSSFFIPGPSFEHPDMRFDQHDLHTRPQPLSLNERIDILGSGNSNMRHAPIQRPCANHFSGLSNPSLMNDANAPQAWGASNTPVSAPGNAFSYGGLYGHLNTFGSPGEEFSRLDRVEGVGLGAIGMNKPLLQQQQQPLPAFPFQQRRGSHRIFAAEPESNAISTTTAVSVPSRWSTATQIPVAHGVTVGSGIKSLLPGNASFHASPPPGLGMSASTELARGTSGLGLVMPGAPTARINSHMDVNAYLSIIQEPTSIANHVWDIPLQARRPSPTFASTFSQRPMVNSGGGVNALGGLSTFASISQGHPSTAMGVPPRQSSPTIGNTDLYTSNAFFPDPISSLTDRFKSVQGGPGNLTLSTGLASPTVSQPTHDMQDWQRQRNGSLNSKETTAEEWPHSAFN
ncbi:Stress response protein nst1 [Batrachochytrium dendrobatidis]|nr:Stress response protein nst1 [Batrachochytrium dendrobatidis]